MKNKYAKKAEKKLQIAEEEVEKLVQQAKEMFNEDPELSKKYITMARRIAMKFRLKLPSKIKKQFCKHCSSYLMPGKSCRIRLKNGKLVYCCLSCKKYMRFPYKPKRQD